MSHVPHELTEHFPDAGELLQALKLSDAHFARLSERYHEVNRQVHRAETDVEPLDDAGMTALRSERMHLLDEIAVILRTASA